MKFRTGMLISVIGTLLWTLVMYGMNQHIATASGRGQVAGAQRTLSENTPPFNNELTNAVNTLRKSIHLEPLREDTRLNTLAELRLNDMIHNRYYAHENKTGEDFADYLSIVGFSDTTMSCENLLMTNNLDASTRITEWKVSTPHARCMLDSNMNTVGYAEGVFDKATGQVLIVSIYAQAQ